MSMDLRAKSLEFLHQWVNKNFVAGIRKGMVEELEAFALSVSADAEAMKAAQRMQAQTIEAVPVEKPVGT